jgi:hypothetical protein
MTTKTTKIKFYPKCKCVRCRRTLRSERNGICGPCLLKIADIGEAEIMDKKDMIRMLRLVYNYAVTGR